MSRRYNVAIVGATGLVGQEMRRTLERREFPVAELRLLASARSKGRTLPWRGAEIPVDVLGRESFGGVDIALFSAGSGPSERYAPIARDAGAVVIDNSSFWRMYREVPLVVPEVNPADLKKHGGIIANPNCSTIQMVVALKPLHDLWSMSRVVVSTYQAVSGTGQAAVTELREQTRAVVEGKTVQPSVYSHQIAFNIFPHIDVFRKNDYSNEEIKMMDETRKIMGLPELRITATTARVPVIDGHSESVNVEFENPVNVDEARAALKSAPGVELLDDPGADVYPTPATAAGTDPCYVGRLRIDLSVKNTKGEPCALNMWVVADNLRKGAALNAVQIAETLIDQEQMD